MLGQLGDARSLGALERVAAAGQPIPVTGLLDGTEPDLRDTAKEALAAVRPVLVASLFLLISLSWACRGGEFEPAASPRTESAVTSIRGDAGPAIGERYADPKGTFKINPPSGWNRVDYPEDPRGKVLFRGPEPGVEFRVLVSEWGELDFESFFEAARENAEIAERQLGARVVLARETLFDREVVRRSLTVRDQRMTAVMFLDGPWKHDLQYSAPLASYDHHEEVVRAAIGTYEPLRSGAAESHTEHQLANSLRLAMLFHGMKREALALEYVERGLAIDPENERLLELRRQLAE